MKNRNIDSSLLCLLNHYFLSKFNLRFKMKVKVLLLFLLFNGVLALAQTTKVIINADVEKSVINKHIYGHFAEHLGRCIYDGIYVGDNNKDIPNVAGLRTDIIGALKDLKVPNLRWPGGCFADTYQWKDGIGPKNKRPRIVNIWWGGLVEDNSFGTHEFLDLCEKIDAQPYLAANVGSGTVKDLMDWVDYLNSDTNSDMAVKRRTNGREKPWGVTMWGVGNEAWGCGGNMTADFYSNIYRQYSTFMTDWSNSSKMYRIASGASDGDYAWTESLMKNIPHNMLAGVALHHYSVIDWSAKGPATGYTEWQYWRIMEEMWKMDKFIKGHSTIMDKYDPDKKVHLIVDEWGGWYEIEKGGTALYQQNSMRDAVIAGTTLNIFHDHADRVKGANIAQIVNVLQSVILTEGSKMILTPTYHVMKMYNVHQDAKSLNQVVSGVPNYTFDGKSVPAVSVSSSKAANGSVNISLVNVDYSKSNKISIDLRGMNFKNISGELLESSNASDHNTFQSPNVIKPKKLNGLKIVNNQIEVMLPPHSVAVLNVN
jgi:alpha-N-arabinofuranosidase